MSGAIYGISGFVDGFMNARNQRLDRARQEKLDAMAAETHAAQMDAYGREKSDWQLRREDDERIRAAGKAYGEAQQRYYEEQQRPMGAVNADASGAVETGQPITLLPMGAQVQPLLHPGQSMQPPQVAAQQPVVTTTSTMGAQQQGQQGAARTPVIGPVATNSPSLPGQSLSGLGLAPQAKQELPAPELDPSMGRIVRSRVTNDDMLLRPDGSVYWLSTGQRETDPQIIDLVRKEGMTRAPEVQEPLGAVPMPTTTGQQPARLPSGDGVAHPLPQPSVGATDTNTPRLRGTTRAEQEQYNNAPHLRGQKSPADIAAAQPQPMPAATATTGAATMGAGAVPTKGDPAAAVAEATATTAQAVIKVGASASGAMGLKPGDKITPAQREKAADAGYNHYMKDAGQKVIQAFLESGDLEGAQKFQEYLDQKQTKDGIKSWSTAMFLVRMGDFKGAGEQLIKAYNNQGYFPDGMSVVESESGFIFGDKNNPEVPTGAKITFKDETTGKKSVQTFTSAQDFMDMAFAMVSPEMGFQSYQQQAAEAGKAGPEQAKAAADFKLKRADMIATEKKLLLGGVIGEITPEISAQAEAAAAAAVDARLGIGPAPDAMGATLDAGAQPEIIRRPGN